MHAKESPEDLDHLTSRRIHIASILVVLIGFFYIGRLGYIQLVDHDFYEGLAKKQYVRTLEDGFNRGTIYLSNQNGELIPAAQLAQAYTIAVDPSRLDEEDKEDILTSLSPIIKKLSAEKAVEKVDIEASSTKEEMLTASIREKLDKKDDPYEALVQGLDEKTYTTLIAQGLPVRGEPHNVRAYTQGSIGAKVIGFLGNDGVRLSGRYGIERYYEDVLAKNKEGVRTNFFAELFSDISVDGATNVYSKQGDVVLTIDGNVERVLHQELVRTKDTWRSDSIGGIIMDIQTGAIIGMESLPTFDPRSFGDVKDSSYFQNQLVSGVYEMGSIIKPLTMAAAIDSQVVTEDSTYNDTGFREIDGYKIRNYDGVARGRTDMTTILGRSLNVGIVYLVEKLGIDRFQGYMKSFGITRETGIDLPAEAHGLTTNLDSPVLVDNATSGFGQGIALTPIQTVRALATLGNGGMLVTPYITKSILFDDGTSKDIIPLPQERVISEETSTIVTRMLVNIVDTILKDGANKMEGYSIAAKTGTAQIPKPGGGYYDDRYLHSFFGYFPAYQPRYIVFLFHVYPKGAQYASATLTDPFFAITKFLISYYQIPPDRRQ